MHAVDSDSNSFLAGYILEISHHCPNGLLGFLTIRSDEEHDTIMSSLNVFRDVLDYNKLHLEFSLIS